MCPRELVEKDGACKRAKDKQRRSSGPRSFLRGKEREITVDGSSLTVVPLNMRCRRPRVLSLFSSSSSLFLFSFFLSCPVLSLSLSLSLRGIARVSSPLETAEFSSLSRLLVQHVIIKPVVAAAISCHGSLTLSSNSSLCWPRWKSIFDDSVCDHFRIRFSKRKSFLKVENSF